MSEAATIGTAAGTDRRATVLTAITCLAVGFAVLIGAFWETVSAAVGVWANSATYNHGFLVAPISAWLIRTRRDRLAGLAPRPFPPGLILFPVFGAAWLVARAAGIMEGQQFAFMGLVQALLLTVLGPRIYRVLLFPFLFLIFMVPTGEFLVPHLQDFTAAFCVVLLRLVGVPVYSDGIFIAIPDAAFEVAEACAGLRFLIATIAFGAVFAYVSFRGWRRRAVFMTLCLVVPILANGLRAFGIILLAHATDSSLAAGVDHLIYGWVFFSAVLLLLVWIGSRFADPPKVSASVAASPRPPVAPAVIVATTVVALAAAGAAPVYAAWRDGGPDRAAPVVLDAPSVDGGWRRLGRSDPAEDAVFPGADARVSARYGHDGHDVVLQIAFYDRQRHGAKILSSEARFVAEGWLRTGGGAVEVRHGGRSMTVVEERFRSGDRYRTVWRWYWVGGRFTGDGMQARLLQARTALLGGQRAAAIVMVATDGPPDRAEGTLAAFLAELDGLEDALARAVRTQAPR